MSVELLVVKVVEREDSMVVIQCPACKKDIKLWTNDEFEESANAVRLEPDGQIFPPHVVCLNSRNQYNEYCLFACDVVLKGV